MIGRKLATLWLVVLAGVGTAFAQGTKPLSPAGTASTMVGGTWGAPEANGAARYSGGKWIEVTYCRPMLRGRVDIFGKGADYGKAVTAGAPVWRVGANQTTKLNTEVALEIGGKKIEPGSYDLFVDLKESGWTLILSTQPTQEKHDTNDKVRVFGAENYDPKFDVVRVPMRMVPRTVSIDQLTIGFLDMTSTGGALAIAWEKTAALVPFTVAP